MIVVGCSDSGAGGRAVFPNDSDILTNGVVRDCAQRDSFGQVSVDDSPHLVEKNIPRIHTQVQFLIFVKVADLPGMIIPKDPWWQSRHDVPMVGHTKKTVLNGSVEVA